MISLEIQSLIDHAEESHQAAKVLLDNGFLGFSAAQSYYTIFYLAQGMLLSKELTFSSHSAVVAAYGREFAKTGLLDLKFHRYIIEAQKRRQTGHYGDEGEELTSAQALESFQWAEEFMQAVKDYLGA
jgi:uncharacterized protein (UPF0332 family)